MKLAQYLTKGKCVLVEGDLLNPNIWEDKEGNAKCQLRIKANSIQFVSTARKQDKGPSSEDNSTVNTPNGADVETNMENSPFLPPSEDDNVPF